MKTFDERKQKILTLINRDEKRNKLYKNLVKRVGNNKLLNPTTEKEMELAEVLCLIVVNISYLSVAAKYELVNVPDLKDNLFAQAYEELFVDYLENHRIDKPVVIMGVDEAAKFVYDAIVFSESKRSMENFMNSLGNKYNFNLNSIKDLFRLYYIDYRISLKMEDIYNYIPSMDSNNTINESVFVTVQNFANTFIKLIKENEKEISEDGIFSRGMKS